MSARALVLLLPLLTGCYAYVREGDPTPLPAAGWVGTRGGQRLDVDDSGALVLGHAPGDIEAALGVTLEERDGAVTVAAVRSSTDGAVVLLEPGDVLLEVRGLAPWLPDEAAEGAMATPVREVEDLRGLAIGLPDLALELRIRRGGREGRIRQPLRAPTPVATRPWAPELAAPLGVEVVRLDDWPASRLPGGATPGDYLVTRVQAGSHGALAGLRPLDVIVNADGRFDVLMGNLPPQLEPLRDEVMAQLREDPANLVTRVRATDGREKALELERPRAPRDSALPLLYSYESNDLRAHLGLLPFDWLFHRSVSHAYDPLSDGVARSTRWSFLTIVQVQGLDGGAEHGASFRVDPLIDEPRLRYAIERLFAE